MFMLANKLEISIEFTLKYVFKALIIRLSKSKLNHTEIGYYHPKPSLFSTPASTLPKIKNQSKRIKAWVLKTLVCTTQGRLNFKCKSIGLDRLLGETKTDLK